VKRGGVLLSGLVPALIRFTLLSQTSEHQNPYDHKEPYYSGLRLLCSR
jgi:hypothetical protein